MRELLSVTLISLSGYLGFSVMMIMAIAWSHYPFTLKEFANDFVDWLKSAKFARRFMKGKTLKSKGEKDNGKHRKERDHHY